MRQIKSLPLLLVCIGLNLFGFTSLLYADQLEYKTEYVEDNTQLKVLTSTFTLAKTLFQHTVVLLDIQLDQLTLPPAKADIISGASRPQRNALQGIEYKKNRGQFIVGAEQGLGSNTQVSLNYYNSQEEDYRSQAVIGGLTQELFNKNLTVSLLGQYDFDFVGEILTDGSVRDRNKEVFRGAISFTQLLNPTTFLNFGFDGRLDSGYLGDPYRTTPFGDLNKTLVPEKENLPNARYRSGAFIGLNHFLTSLNGSVLINYRYYWDDWEINSNTLSFKLNKYINRNWIFSPEYRFYTQTKSIYYKQTISTSDLGAYYSSDPKLANFDDHTASATLTCFLRTFVDGNPDLDFLQQSSISLMYSRYFRRRIQSSYGPENLSSNVYEASLRFSF